MPTIDDGYTLDGFIKESPGLYKAVRFRYRPVVPSERVEVFEGWDLLPGKDKLARMAKAMARCIKNWDYKTPQGVPVPCNKSDTYIAMREPALYDRLQEIVFQVTPPDVDPDKEDKHESENAAETGAGN